MEKYRIIAAVLIAFLLGLSISLSWGETNPKWKLLGKYNISKDDEMQVICDAERGNIIYVTKIHWNTNTLGYFPAPLHQPEDCSLSDPK